MSTGQRCPQHGGASYRGLCSECRLEAAAPPTCPYCSFVFPLLTLLGTQADVVMIPIICSKCAEVGVWDIRDVLPIRKMTENELEGLKTSPAWSNFIKPAREQIFAERRRKVASNN